MATIKDVAKAARVSTATVSAVINDSAYVSPSLRARVLEAIRSLDYSPSQLARNLRRGRNELIALVVADLANPFYARVVWAAEAAVAAWGYSLVVFNSDEKPEAEKRIFARVQALQCEGLLLVPVGNEFGIRTSRRRWTARPDSIVRAHDRRRFDGLGHDRQRLGELSGDQLPSRPRAHAHWRHHGAHALEYGARSHGGSWRRPCAPEG